MIIFAFIGALLTFCGCAFVIAYFIAAIVAGAEPEGGAYAFGFGTVLFIVIFVALVTIFSFHSDPESFGYMKIPTETAEEVTK